MRLTLAGSHRDDYRCHFDACYSVACHSGCDATGQCIGCFLWWEVTHFGEVGLFSKSSSLLSTHLFAGRSVVKMWPSFQIMLRPKYFYIGRANIDNRWDWSLLLEFSFDVLWSKLLFADLDSIGFRVEVGWGLPIPLERELKNGKDYKLRAYILIQNSPVD